MTTVLSPNDYRTVVEQAPIMIWRCDRDAKCDYFNQRWLLFTGRPVAEELGEGWIEGVHTDDRDRCKKTFLDAFRQREMFEMEYRLRRYDGEYRWVLDCGSPTIDAAGEFTGYVGSAVDVTDRVQARAQLARANMRELGFEGV